MSWNDPLGGLLSQVVRAITEGMEQFQELTWEDFVRLDRRADIEPTGSTESFLRSIFMGIFEDFPDGIAVARVQRGLAPLLYVNRAFERLTGCSRHEALGKDCRSLQNTNYEQQEFTRSCKAIEAFEPLEVRLRNYRKDGSTSWNCLSLAPIAVGSDMFYLGMLRDVSAIRQAESAPNVAANIYIATGCLNRQSFVAAVENRFSTHVGPMLIVKLDVVGFHDVNAGYGFDVGDALLHETGRRLKQTGAILVARMGANEFALAFELHNEADDQKCATNVSSKLSPDFVVPGANVSLRFAIGYAVSEPGGNAISLLRNAGTALHAAKADPFSGPRGFRVTDAEDACNRLRMTRELKLAIANDEFVYHFQPQVDLVTGECVGAEALIRWNHPLFGSQPPGRFIEAAERTGLLLELGERGLLRAARFARRINQCRHRPLRFSVNVSAIEFLHRDMAEVLERVLQETDALPNWLTLEITESMLLDNTPHVVGTFGRLRDLGLGLSVDDFGTGYSSLSLLEKFPVTEIKIDKSFVGGLAKDTSKKIIVQAVIDLGRALDVAVVAEGVENDTQRTLLKDMGCPIGQGYLLGVPTDADTFSTSLFQGDGTQTA